MEKGILVGGERAFYCYMYTDANKFFVSLCKIIVRLLISVLFLFSVFASDTGENQPL